MWRVVLTSAALACGCENGVTYDVGVTVDHQLDAHLVQASEEVPEVRTTIEVGHYTDLDEIDVTVDVRYQGQVREVSIPFAGCSSDGWEPDGAIVDVSMNYVITAASGRFDVTMVNGSCEDEHGNGWGYVIREAR